jgi:hypothetical protein
VSGSGAGEEALAGLVHRGCEYPGVFVEESLYAVTVVSVEIQVGHSAAGLHSQSEGDRAVVVDAEARGRGLLRVVVTARRTEGAPCAALHDGPHRLDGGARVQSGGVVDVWKQRVIGGAETEEGQVSWALGASGYGLGPLHRLDEGVGVHRE